MTSAGTCRTLDDVYAAGYAAGAASPPLTRDQAIRIALLLTPATTTARTTAA